MARPRRRAPALRAAVRLAPVVAGCLAAPSRAAARQPPARPDSVRRPPVDSVPRRLTEVRVTERRRGYADTSASVGLKLPASILDVPQSVQTVGRQVIEDRQLLTARETARLVSGLAPGRSATNELVIRGLNDNGATQSFGAGGSNFAVNGLKNYFAGYESDVTLVNVERVEVLKGASGVLYGFNQPGGVVNLVTKQPLAAPAYAFSASAGTWRRTRVEADLTGPVTRDGRVRYRLNAAALSSPDYRGVFFNRAVVVAPTLAVDVSDRTRLGAELLYSRTQRTAWYDWGVPARDAEGRDVFARVDRQYTPHQLGDLATLEALGGVVTLDHAFGRGVTFRSATSLGGNSIDVRGHVPSFAAASPNAAGDVGVRYRLVDADYDGVFSTNYAAAEFRTGRLGHRLVAGVDVMSGASSGRETSASNSDALPGNVAPMNAYRPAFGVRQAGNYVYNGGYTIGTAVGSAGVYAQDLVSLGDRVQLLAGVRADRYRARAGVGAPAGTNNPVLPNLGLVVKPARGTSLYASYLRGFEPQVVTDPAAGGPFDPLTAWQAEAGVKRLWAGGALTTTASVYRIERRNELVSANDEANPSRLRPLGRTRSEGVEVDVSGSPLPALNLTASYAFNNARPVASDDPTLVGRRLPNAPAHIANVWLRYDVPAGPLRGLGVAAGANGVSSRFGAFEGTRYPGYALVDAALSYRFDNVTVAVNAYNLADRRYLSGIWSDFYAQRGLPRNVLVRLGFVY